MEFKAGSDSMPDYSKHVFLTFQFCQIAFLRISSQSGIGIQNGERNEMWKGTNDFYLREFKYEYLTNI